MSNAQNLNRWASVTDARIELVNRGYSPSHTHPNMPQLWKKAGEPDLGVARIVVTGSNETWWELAPYPHAAFKENADVHTGGTEDSAANESQENT